MVNVSNLPWYFWLVAVAFFAGAWWLHRRSDDAMRDRGAAIADKLRKSLAESVRGEAAKAPPKTPVVPAGGELVAVIAAAVAAASGLEPTRFRIAGISPVGSTGIAGVAGQAAAWNTPVWGRVERFARTQQHR